MWSCGNSNVYVLHPDAGHVHLWDGELCVWGLVDIRRAPSKIVCHSFSGPSSLLSHFFWGTRCLPTSAVTISPSLALLSLQLAAGRASVCFLT